MIKVNEWLATLFLITLPIVDFLHTLTAPPGPAQMNPGSDSNG